jgi:hypothetical protein
MLNRTTLSGRTRPTRRVICTPRISTQASFPVFKSTSALGNMYTCAACNLIGRSAAKPEHMLTDAAGKSYFPDVKLKNTPMGRAKKDSTFSSFNAILRYDQLSSSSKRRAQSGEILARIGFLALLLGDKRAEI